MSFLENSTFSGPWWNGRWRASFSIYPEITGNHNIVFKGTAFSFSALTSVKIYVKTVTTNTEARSLYMDRCKQGNIMVDKFNQMVSNWNLTRMAIGRVIFLQPACVFIDVVTNLTKLVSNVHLRKNESVVFEERLNGKFTHFVSKDGKLEKLNNLTEILNAFCHFTFLVSEGKIVICGLKGIYDKTHNEYRLTNPTVYSKEARFGSKDMGEQGIIMFCKNHVCNKLCRKVVKSFKRECAGVIKIWNAIRRDYTVTLPPPSTSKPLVPTAPFQEYVDEPYTPFIFDDPPPPYRAEDLPPQYQLEWAHTSYLVENLLVQTLKT